MAVEGVGINDMPYGWTTKSELNRRIYGCWRGFLHRCYNKKYQKKYPTYKSCYVCDRWLLLSNFVEDIVKIEGYKYWLEHPNERVALDKDIKSNGNNKCYCLEQCMFVAIETNTKQANDTRNYEEMKGSNNRGAKKLSKRIVAINLETKEVFYFNSTREAERELTSKYGIKFNHSLISQVCNYHIGKEIKNGNKTHHREFDFFFEEDYKGE